MRSEDGFTLVELLVSLALLSLMVVYALNAIATTQSINRVTDEIAAQMEVDFVIGHFSDTIADVRPFLDLDEFGKSKLYFSGSGDSFEIATVADGKREIGGVYLARYRINENSELVTERRLLRDNGVTPLQSVTILKNVKHMTVTYLDRTRNAVATWNSTSELPLAIDIEMEFPPGDNRIWPPSHFKIEGQGY